MVASTGLVILVAVAMLAVVGLVVLVIVLASADRASQGPRGGDAADRPRGDSRPPDPAGRPPPDRG